MEKITDIKFSLNCDISLQSTVKCHISQHSTSICKIIKYSLKFMQIFSQLEVTGNIICSKHHEYFSLLSLCTLKNNVTEIFV